MPINSLDDLRDAVAAYVPANVTVTIDEPQPDVGSEIDPNEEFVFTVRATNANETNGGVRLTDVKWHVKMGIGDATQLIVPDAPLDTRSGPSEDFPTLTPGNAVSEMWIFPRFGKKVLEVGETDRIELRGRATSNPSGEVASIEFEITASVDEEWLFPKDQSAGPATRGINITG